MQAITRRKPSCRCADPAPTRRQRSPDRSAGPGNQARLRRLPTPHRCAACEGEAKPQRVASDNPDTELRFPRQPGSDAGANPVPPVDAGAAPTPAGPDAAAVASPQAGGAATAGDCCNAALAQHLDQGDLGGIICCNNTRIACVWQANLNREVTNAAAQPIVERCVRVHETTHLGQVDCTGAAVERPNFRAGVDASASECTAYRAEIQCYNAHIDDCGADAACRSAVTSELAFAQRQRTAFCGA
jgi:hypothetical protein